MRELENKNPIDWEKRYAITCPYCGEKLTAQKSIFHHMGNLESGLGSCLKCLKLMQLIFNPEDDSMSTKKIARGE